VTSNSEFGIRNSELGIPTRPPVLWGCGWEIRNSNIGIRNAFGWEAFLIGWVGVGT
jgi:hypothetical protein